MAKKKFCSFSFSSKTMELIENLPKGLRSKVVEAIILDAFSRFKNTQELVGWALNQWSVLREEPVGNRKFHKEKSTNSSNQNLDKEFEAVKKDIFSDFKDFEI